MRSDQDTSSIQKIADYQAVQQKGAEIFRAGGVEPVSVTSTYSQAYVHSSSGQTYLNLLEFPSGDSSKIENWACECPWSLYNYKRAPDFQYLEHRKCSHSLAHLYFLMSFKYTKFSSTDIERLLSFDQ